MFGTRIWSKLVLGVVGPLLAATLLLAGTQTAAFGASALPVVLSFGASRTSIPNRGGTIVLNAKLQYASGCEISSSVHLKGFPIKFSCKSEIVKKRVTLPTNKSQNPIAYTFGLTARNAAGSTKATNTVVTEGVGPPLSLSRPRSGARSRLSFFLTRASSSPTTLSSSWSTTTATRHR